MLQHRGLLTVLVLWSVVEVLVSREKNKFYRLNVEEKEKNPIDDDS